MAHETHLFDTLFLLDDTGTIVITNRETKAGVRNRFRDAEGFIFPGHEALDQEEIAISKWQPISIGLGAVNTIMLSFPVLDEDEEFLGTVVGLLDVATLSEPLKQELSELAKRGFGSSIVAIIDGPSGRIRLKAGGEEVSLETIELEGDEPSSRTSRIEDRLWLAFTDHTAFGENELVVVTLTAKDSLAEAARRLLEVRGVIYVLVIVVLGAIVVWVTKTLSDPLRRLTGQAENFGKGDYYTDIHVDARDETGRLAAVLNESRKNIGSKMVAIGAQKREIERQFRESQQLLGIASRLTAELDLDVLLAEIMKVTTTILKAERSTLFMYDSDTHELWSRVAGGQGPQETIRFPASDGVAGASITSGQCINIPDAYQDSRF